MVTNMVISIGNMKGIGEKIQRVEVSKSHYLSHNKEV